MPSSELLNNQTVTTNAGDIQAVWITLASFYKIIYRGYFSFLIVFGTSFNILTAIILLREKLRRFSTCRYMAVCSLLNAGVLLTNTLYMTLVMGWQINLRSSVLWCRIHVFVSQWFRGFASWILVIVAIDRYQGSRNLRPRTQSKNNIVTITCVIAGVALVFPNIHYLLLIGGVVTLKAGDLSYEHYACSFHKNSTNPIHRWLALSNTWLELITIIFIPSILTLIFNIFIIKNSFIKPLNNEKLKSRSKSRTRRVTTMLLASNIGFLALVSPAQIFYALTFDPHSIKSQDKYFFSYMIKAQIYQCLINTYYAMNFVFCFASSSFFRREIQKFINSSDLRRKSETSSANNIITNKKFYNNDKVMETTTMLGENKSCMVDDTTVVTD